MSWFVRYKKITVAVKKMVLLEFFLQLVNAAYFMVFNFYLHDLGFDDSYIAGLISIRFVATMILALPLGLFVKKKKMLPFFRFAAACIPLSSALVIVGSIAGETLYLQIGILGMGIGTTIAQSLMIPFIMRNEPVETRMEAIALHFTTWSTTTFLLGSATFLTKSLFNVVVSDLSLLVTVTALASCAVVISLTTIAEKTPDKASVSRGLLDYDWPKIGHILAPAFIIGVGAGLTIPFINLFFLHVFAMSSQSFLLLGSVATVFVTAGSMYGPRLAERFGPLRSVVGSQSIAVAALVVMAVTSYYAESPVALTIACFGYLVRQPLMNLANPILSGFTMTYVGPKNQELASSLQQSLWAGSWFFSSQIFALMRDSGLSYASVLLTTAGIYSVGVYSYYGLIRTRRLPVSV